MPEVKIALIQTVLHWEDPNANFRHFDSLIQSLENDVEVIVLPEMFSTGFTMEPNKLNPDVGTQSLDWMRKKSNAVNAALVGSTVWHAEGEYFNRLFFVKPDGETAAYDKRHTFTLAGEDKIYQAGTKKMQVMFKGFNWCPLICYDLRFPVWTRNTEMYDVLLFVANWPGVRIGAWDSLLKARAIENLSYTIGLNRVGSDPNGNDYPGHSAVFNALGERIAYSEREEIIYCHLNSEHLENTRNQLGFLDDRDVFTIL